MGWTKPRALRRGDLIGVCSPSSPSEPEKLEQGVATLRGLGFEVRVAPHTLARRGFTAGPPADRLRDLHELVRDPDVAAVIFARGGAGGARLLPGLDLELLRAHPKPLVGYSDVTLLHLVQARLKMTAFHGPMVAHELADGGEHRPSLLWALTGEGEPYATGEGALEVVREGAAEGRLLGGCLSLVAAAAGTPWAFRAEDDTLLFLEDLNERPYRIDRLLFQLRHSGVLERVRGIVFGDLSSCAAPPGLEWTLADVIREALDGLDVPIAAGLSSGHTRPNVTLPLGVRARLTCAPSGARFQVLESPLS
jgi:muramoyltetrapeptide carboxypeptidase